MYALGDHQTTHSKHLILLKAFLLLTYGLGNSIIYYLFVLIGNPKWPEIQASLFPGESADDRPDICARVFQLKKQELMVDLLDRQVLGRVKGHILAKEDQKRGLPVCLY